MLSDLTSSDNLIPTRTTLVLESSARPHLVVLLRSAKPYQSVGQPAWTPRTCRAGVGLRTATLEHRTVR